MGVAATVIRFLDRQQVAYTVHNLIHFESVEDAANRLGIAKHSLIYTVPLIDQFGLILAILPADRALNFTQLNSLMGRNFTLASTTQALAVFRDCDCAYLPPLGEAYAVRAILDDSVVDSKLIYFITGDSRHIIQVNSQGFLHLQNQACIASNFTDAATPHGQSAVVEAVATDATPTNSKIRAALTTLGALPPMPAMAQQIFGLSANPYAGAKELAEIINLDPSLSAQVLRYARSPLFGYQGELDSIQTAISRVLGFDMVMNLSLGLATAKPFRVQRSGPLGLDSFWRHAIYSAVLVQALGKELSADKRPNPGLAYLSGLLHNFGHLLMGHLAKQEFAQLNELVLEYPDVAVIDIEERLLGVSHDEVGAVLMEKWGLPDQIVMATREHHNALYEGPHKVYAQLVLLADHMLKGHRMGDAQHSDLPEQILAELHLNEVHTLKIMNRVLEGCEGFNTMAQQLAA